MKRDYIEFQERSIAVGYLITFRCYGTWFHGDVRGSVDRRYFNLIGTPGITPDPEMVQRKTNLLKDQPFYLDVQKRKVVNDAILEVCRIRNYGLFALNVRTSHAHVVVGNAGEPERIMNSFKAYSTKALRNADLIGKTEKPWSRHGSTRYLWTDEHISMAVEYVLNGQGDDLPIFD